MTKLSSSVTDALTFQSYAPAPAVEGVWTAPLRKSRSDNGSFMEYVRLSEGLCRRCGRLYRPPNQRVGGRAGPRQRLSHPPEGAAK